MGPDAYSYVFDGQWGYLDHALGSSSLVPQVTGVGDYHINADEPSVLDYNTDFKTPNLITTLYAPDEFRVSDHDSVLVGLALNDAPSVSAGGPYTVAAGGSVQVSAAGSDPNGDALTYAWDLDNNGSFETAGQTATFSAAGLQAPAVRTIRVQVTDTGGLTATAEATVNIVYGFSGFFSPVSNPPQVNKANSGQAIPIKFSLGGNQGLGVIVSATSVQVSCDTGAPLGPEVPAKNPGHSGLSYGSGQYNFVWKTEKSWAHQCRQFRLTLNDGTLHVADFNFTK